jgi:hypothetical protein
VFERRRKYNVNLVAIAENAFNKRLAVEFSFNTTILFIHAIDLHYLARDELIDPIFGVVVAQRKQKAHLQILGRLA